jgi:ribosomal 50S subunit-recycling heat shock protein
MRIDKFLKNARLIKRRTIAKEACDQGRVLLNGKVAKAGTEVKIGDVITINFGSRMMKVVVKDIKEHVLKEDTKDLYEIIQ